MAGTEIGSPFGRGIGLKEVKLLVHRFEPVGGVGATVLDGAASSKPLLFTNFGVGGCESGGVSGVEGLPEIEKDLRPERILVGNPILMVNSW